MQVYFNCRYEFFILVSFVILQQILGVILIFELNFCFINFIFGCCSFICFPDLFLIILSLLTLISILKFSIFKAESCFAFNIQHVTSHLILTKMEYFSLVFIQGRDEFNQNIYEYLNFSIFYFFFLLINLITFVLYSPSDILHLLNQIFLFSQDAIFVYLIVSS
jgi:hypothetical protein